MTHFVSVIIVDFNSGEKLLKCLRHLQNQTYKNFEVILINNGADTQTEESFSEFGLKVTLLNPGENLGFAKANNEGVKKAKGHWLAFLNPDAYPNPDWLEILITATRRYPDVKAFGSTQLMASDKQKLDGAGDVYHVLGIPYRGYFGWDVEHLPSESDVFAACAAAALYEANIFRQLGGFDERFFCYGEDVDLGYRLRLIGGRTLQIPDAVVHHEGSGITGRHSDFTIYHGHRNRIWLAYKNTPFWLYWPVLPLHILANLYLLFRAPFAGITKPYLKGILHGYAGLARFKADRRRLQSQRNVSYRSLIKALEWSPVKLSKRQGRNW